MPNLPDYAQSGIPRYGTPMYPSAKAKPDGTIDFGGMHESWYRYFRHLDSGINPIIFCTQATFPVLLAIPSDTLIVVTDYAHLIQWDGTTATFADEGSDYYALGERASGSPGWHEADGSVTDYLNADGTVTAKTLENVDASTRFLAAIDSTDALHVAADTGDTALATTVPESFGTGTPQLIQQFGTDPHHHAPGQPASFSAKLWYRR